jgi:Polysaccharide biosynthesis C-terminal domain
VMSYKVKGFSVGAVLGDLWRPVLASLLMAEAMWLVTKDVESDHGWEAVVQLIVAGAVGLVVYAVVLFVLRVPDIDGVIDRFRRRKPARATNAA